MTYSVIYTQSALRDIKKLPPEVAVKIALSINGIKENPYSNLKKIKTASRAPIYSFRIGEYRALMTVEDLKLIIFVIEVGHRSKIYRKF